MVSAQRYSIKRFREQGKTLRMLFLWKGSVYRLIWNEILLWIILYFALNSIYRFVFNDTQKEAFERIVTDVERGVSFVPLSFVLGFYANLVVTRYWSMWDNLPRPDTLALRISTVIQGKEPRDRQFRRTAMRHIILALVLTFRKISRPVMNRYPTLDSLVKKGLLNKEEKAIIEGYRKDAPPFWLPLVWVGSLFETARQEKRIKDDFALGQLSTDLTHFRNFCGKTLQVDLIGIPLAYSQVVAIACYTFWAGSIIARQAVLNTDVSQENYVPIFTILQLVIFFGWLCVAESMIHPFGDDDDDFQLSWMIDYHINITYEMVDATDHPIPSLTDDSDWERLVGETARERSPPPSPVLARRTHEQQTTSGGTRKIAVVPGSKEEQLYNTFYVQRRGNNGHHSTVDAADEGRGFRSPASTNNAPAVGKFLY